MESITNGSASAIRRQNGNGSKILREHIRGRNGPAILVTMQGTHVFTQAEYQHAFGHIPDGFPYSINYLCGKYLVFPNHEAILKYLQRKVGDLSYDVIQTKGFHAH